ncbi:uncharacterized protein [Pagrus major]|uniref:uncharacterized protein n=1 Tax=Pagrus major TaxID=143350 RepID=UPI003CC88AAF
MLSPKPAPPTTPTSFNPTPKLSSPIDNTSNSFSTDKCNSFLSFFQTKIDNIYSNLSTSPTPTPSTPSLTPPPLTSQPLSQFSPVSPRDLSTIMAEMKSPTCALDPIPSHLVKNCLPAISSLITNIINSSLSSAFDTIKLSWFQSYLSSRTQCVSFNNSLSECSTVTAGVPQGSVLGPLLFCIYMLPLGRIIAEYGIQFHSYADDTQLYIPLQPNDPSQIQNLETCVSRIKIWMSQNFLMLNTAKTDLLVIKPNNYKYFSDSLCLNIDGCSISESTHIRNLGVIFDPTLTFQTHIKEITRTAFFHLRNIAKIRPALSRRSAEVVLHALVSSRLDYCNVLFSGLPICTTRSLQLVQNSAARLLTKTSRFCHITPVLASLHWLPIQARADFKVLLLTYKALNGLAPSYLTELLSPYIPPRPLRSLSSNLLVIPPINKKSAGGRAFAYRAPFLWNGLPLGIKEATSTAIFKSRLKTHLFTQYFGLN